MKRVIYLLVMLVTVLGASAKDKSYYFQRAEEAYQKQDYEECIRISELGVKEDPKDGYCWGMLAELYSKRANGQYAKALEAAEQGLKYIPKKDTQWQAFLICIKGDVYYKVEDFPASKQAYRQAMLTDKDNTQYPIDYADVCYKMGDFGEGVRVYSELLEDSGGPAYAYAELARGYFKLGRLEDAKQACGMAKALTDDENFNAHHVLARIAIDEGHLPIACREEARALALQNEAYSDVADTLLYLCRPLMDAAMLNDLQKVQTDGNAHIHVANYFLTSANYVKMFEHLLLAEQYGKEHKDLLQGYTLLYGHLGEYDKAVEVVKQWMANDSLSHEHKAFYFSQLAGLYRDNGQADLAFKYSCLDHEADPDDADSYRMAARALIMMGDLQKALTYMDSTVMTADEYGMPTSLFNRAEVFRRMGNEEAAQRDLEEAMTYRNNANQDRTTFFFVEAMQGKREALDKYADSISSAHAFLSVSQAYYDLIGCYALLRDKAKTLQMVDGYFRMGARNVPMIRHYYRLDWLRDDPDFLSLLDKWEAVRQTDLHHLASFQFSPFTFQFSPSSFHLSPFTFQFNNITELPFSMVGGVCQVKCVINGLPLYFVFDTGASDVTISNVEANFMLKNGYLSDADFLGKQNYVTATGEIHEGTVINLREVRVGDVVLNDVKASVVKSQHAPLLLGQSVFRRFGTLEVDNNASIIRFRK